MILREGEGEFLVRLCKANAAAGEALQSERGGW